MIAMMLMSIEWLLLTIFVWICAMAFWPLCSSRAVMMLTPVVLAAIAAWQAQLATKRRHWLMRPLIALPAPTASRSSAAWRATPSGSRAKTLDAEKPDLASGAACPFDPKTVRRLLKYWSKHEERLKLLEQINADVKSSGCATASTRAGATGTWRSTAPATRRCACAPSPRPGTAASACTTRVDVNVLHDHVLQGAVRRERVPRGVHRATWSGRTASAVAVHSARRLARDVRSPTARRVSAAGART